MIPILSFNDSKGSSRYRIVLYYLILGYIVSLFIKNAPVVSNVLMVAILLVGIIATKPNDYLKIIRSKTVNIGILICYVLMFISVIFSNDKLTGFAILSLRLPLFILPLAFCFIEFEEKTWNKILLFYVLAATLASLAGFIYGASFAILNHNPVYYYNDNISELLIGKQAAYFGLYVDVAILAIIHLFKTEAGRNLGKGYLYAIIIWLIFISYMLASKMSSISLVVILLGMALVDVIRKRKFLEGLILVFGLAVGGVILNNFFPETIARFKTITQTKFRFDNTNTENSMDTQFDPDKWSSGSTRMALWNCGKEVFLKRPVFGTGLGDIRTTLKDKYTEKHFIYAVNTNKNLHCQYFDVAVSMGIIGLLVFLATYFTYPLFTFVRNRQGFAITIFLCVGFCLLTENMFDRYQGETLIGFILPLAAEIFDAKKAEA